MEEVEAPSLRSVSRQGRRHRIGPGQRLVHQGGPVDTVHRIVAGLAKVVVDLGQGQEVTLEVLRPGDWVGDAEVLMATTVAPASVVALGDVVTLRIPARIFADYLNRHPSAIGELARALASRLAAADRRRVAAVGLTGARRLAAYLLELTDPAERGPDSKVVRLSQAELAGLMGVSRDSAIRALRLLRSLQLVHTRRRAIVVPSVSALASFVSTVSTSAATPTGTSAEAT